MISSEALKILNTNTPPEIETINLDFIVKFNGSMVKKTLLWAKGISLPPIKNTGLRDLCQLKADSSNDALTAQPLNWGLKLKEIQVTNAIRIFLDVETESRQGRIESFLKAFGVEPPNKKTEYYVANEHPFEAKKGQHEGGRFDIMIAWGQNKAPFDYGLICEFKLGSEIGANQLTKYETASKGIIRNPTFVFISERYKKADFEALKTTSKIWTTRLWWKFLRDWESHITNEIDDNEFRQFRARLWDQLA